MTDPREQRQECACGDIREGSIFHWLPFLQFWLECPRCHNEQKVKL